MLPTINATLGLSYDLFTNSIDTTVGKINPKFGLQWDLNHFLRLRATWFESTKSHIMGQQSLEPTQVAGFNQFYDDYNGTRSRRMGLGLDFKVNEKLFGGFEISNRLIKIPVKDNQNPPVEDFRKYEEELYRTYLYWTPHSFWTLKGDFLFERTSSSDTRYFSLPANLGALSVPLAIEYFHPSGVFSRLTGTYICQDLTRSGDGKRKRDFAKTQSGVDNFFLLDLAVGFRLLNCAGIISMEGKNLLDENFYFMDDSYKTSEPVSPRFIPDRNFFVKLTLNF